jgi:hypothetical protein
MPDQLQCIWTGKSGTGYTYFIHPLPVNFDANQDGNYIYTKQNSQGLWVPIYIGQGDLRDRVSDNHHQAACIKKKGATHVHGRLNPKEKERIAEESDLLANYTNAYTPNGCNEKEGG